MGMIRKMRCVGGPWDGEEIASSADVMLLDGYPGMGYHRTRPTDTNWRETIDRDWWMHGVPQPVPPDHVWEWHEREWQSPEVRSIRDAIRLAVERAQ